MSTSTRDLTAAQSVEAGKAKTELYGGSLVGTSDEAVSRGFASEKLDTSGRQDSDGTNYVGNPFEREGFLTPGLGYDR